MASYKEIIKQLRNTAKASAKYQNKWLSDVNWVELIKAHDTNSTLTSLELNAAIRKDPSIKDIVDIMDGSNGTGIHRIIILEKTKEGKNRRVPYYYLTQPGSTDSADVGASWASGNGRTTQEICRSASLGNDT
jgi:hypothetical protein